MGRVIPLHPRDHDAIVSLLPWYATGRLDTWETARVEDHLAACADCRAELAMERRLKEAVSAQPVAMEDGWLRLRARMDQDPPGDRDHDTSLPTHGARRFRVPWGVVAIAASVAGVAVVLAPSSPIAPPSAYHTLGAASAGQAGNLVVIFRPDTPERDLRAALRDSGARLVGGPTDADAYVLSVPGARRADVLAGLRRRRDIALAEPIDAGDAK